ncbi:MAG TPA: glycosyltransferase [Rhodanobacteraceae bacterium]|jgi:hopene-associated glycosyltransferase HpnB|nr:glycosyltransferase [Rhodanobacteraceae bacterium]
MAILILAALALACWTGVLAAPWAAWLCREHLEPDSGPPAPRDDPTILIPARNEALVIGETLRALGIAAPGAPVIVIDDQSTDGTATLVRACGLPNLTLVAGTTPPTGWTGKLWALQQGLERAATPRVLLLDADIRLAPGMLPPLQRKADEGCALVSLCAEPCWDGVAARWLLPAFVYFFKLLYPFALANDERSRMAAAAGGVVLVDRAALLDAGGFGAWRDAIIDDCTLAARMKRKGYRCWIGLSHGATSQRQAGFADIAHMIARTAFVQLRESLLLTVAVSALLVVAFWIPAFALAFGPTHAARAVGLLAMLAMLACYVPTLMYYRRNPWAALLLPLAATFFLAATWYSAWRAVAGVRSVWKGRHYQRREA